MYHFAIAHILPKKEKNTFLIGKFAMGHDFPIKIELITR